MSIDKNSFIIDFVTFDLMEIIITVISNQSRVKLVRQILVLDLAALDDNTNFRFRM